MTTDRTQWLEEYKGYKKQIEFAKKLTKEDRILDIGCGEGIITSLLDGKEVIGIDINKDTIKFARNRIREDNKFFLVASATYLPFKNSVFDCVSAFHLIEHLNAEDGLRFLKEVKRVCRAHGRIVIATPNLASFYLIMFKILGLKNKEHVNEMDFVQALNTLTKYFRIVEIHTNTETPWLKRAWLTRFASRLQEGVLKLFPPFKHLFHTQIYVVMINE